MNEQQRMVWNKLDWYASNAAAITKVIHEEQDNADNAQSAFMKSVHEDNVRVMNAKLKVYEEIISDLQDIFDQM